MLGRVEAYIRSNCLFTREDRILVGLSGGRDSVALLYILKRLGYTVAAAHCNFHLRGEESDRDERFVERLCSESSIDIPLFKTDFQTEEYAKDKGISIEMAARELRYGWFNELLEREGYDYLAIAHHSDDVLETFLINVCRGTGLQGLTGIRAKNGKIVRPLLCLTRDEITGFVEAEKLGFVDDSTNFESVYMRNKMRNIIIPAMEEANPSFKKSLLCTISNLDRAYAFNAFCISKVKKEIVSETDSEVSIDIDRLLANEHRDYIFFELLKPYGFSPKIVREILAAMQKNNCQGDLFVSNLGCKAIIDRKKFVIKKNCFTFADGNDNEAFFLITEDMSELDSPIRLSFQKKRIEEFELDKASCVFNLDYSLVQFPLILRRWKKGDVFFPFGMKGKKKVSDFFTDRKLSLFEKESVWILESGGDILWIVGMRGDNRFRITENTKNVLTIRILSKS